MDDIKIKLLIEKKITNLIIDVCREHLTNNEQNDTERVSSIILASMIAALCKQILAITIAANMDEKCKEDFVLYLADEIKTHVISTVMNYKKYGEENEQNK